MDLAILPKLARMILQSQDYPPNQFYIVSRPVRSSRPISVSPNSILQTRFLSCASAVSASSLDEAMADTLREAFGTVVVVVVIDGYLIL